jgi:mannitol/fructose-specific phosphotransferase system IIA component (Ntr-type)
MKSLLNALQAGRLIELPDNNKDRALQYLASLIEAIPDLKPGMDIAEAVLSRERTGNTGLGLGWACPHVRTSNEGELLCAVGWSPVGIDYGALDNRPVRLIILYYIPDLQKNAYLKEISSLAKAIQDNKGLQDIETAHDLTEVRNRMLDLVSAAIEAGVPEAKAKMIRLEAKQAAVAAAVAPSEAVSLAQIVPVTVIVIPGAKSVILSQNVELVSMLESNGDLGAALRQRGQVDVGNYRILSRAATGYQPDRVLYDCLAVKLSAPPAPK